MTNLTIPEYKPHFEDSTPAYLQNAILDSWKRCKRFGVKPEASKANELSRDTLSHRLEKNRILIQFTSAMIRKLFSITENTRQTIALLDEDGYILDCVSNLPGAENPLHFYKVGMKWDETTVGTNANSLAWSCGKPVVVVGKEHYCEQLKDITDYADCIHDVHGRKIASLYLCVKSTKSSRHSLGLVAFGTYIVESHLAMAKSHELMDDMLDTISEGLIILDEKLNIQSVSYQLCKMFKKDRNALYQHNIVEFFAPEDFEQKVFEIKKPFSYFEYEFQVENKPHSYNVSVTPMHLAGKITGAILLLRESKTLNKVANMITGNCARYQFNDIVTNDPKMKNIVTTMKQISASTCSVLIEGESGTGKELFAHSIHHFSGRANGPFVAVNCASLPQSLIESELFGYEKGSFTGALHEGNPGKFELANGGTIFLDEIGELPLVMQAKLLRVLDTHRTLRIGGKAEKVLDIRVIAATNRNLKHEVETNNFREDLYYRINVLKFRIPPLRERNEDVILLAKFFLKRVAEQENMPEKTFSSDFLETLRQYPWPGNVRELQNVISRAHYICSEDTITRTCLPENIILSLDVDSRRIHQEPANCVFRKSCVLSAADEKEKLRILNALAQTNGHVINAGKILGISKSSMYRKLDKYSIEIK